MKKIVALLLMVVLAVSCLPVVPAAAWDYDYYYDKYYYYDSNKDGETDTFIEYELDFSDYTAEITYFSTELSHLIVPEWIKVTYSYEKEYWNELGYWDYDYGSKTSIFTVTGITGIDDEMESMKSIYIPYTVEYIAPETVGYAYTYIETEEDFDYVLAPVSDFKMYCVEDTAGEAYARENGFSCSLFKNIASAEITLEQDSFVYSASALCPGVTVKAGEEILTENIDYTLSYKNNINSGTATVIITGKGTYRGKKLTEFYITPLSAVGATVSPIPEQVYTGGEKKPSVTVTLSDIRLKAGRDYTVSYSNNKNIGTAKAVITFCGNYTGKITTYFKINIGKITGIQCSSSSSAVKIAWNVVKCDEYYLYKYNDSSKKYELYQKLKTNTFTDTGLSQFKKYYYKIKAVKHNVSGVGDVSSPAASASCYTWLSTPSLKLATKNKMVDVSWTKNTKAAGYQIFRSVNMGEYKLYKTIKGNATIQYSDKGVNNSDVYTYMVRAYTTLNGKNYYSKLSTPKCSKDVTAQLNAATLKSHRTFKIYDKQSKTTKVESTVTLSDSDIATLKNFAAKYFKKGMSREDRLRVTLEWINGNVTYATTSNGLWNKICGKSFVDAIFNYKAGQCAQYNGAMASMMCYLGYDAYLIKGWRGSWPNHYWQHYWCEVNIGGLIYMMETGNAGRSGGWSYFLAPYSETSGYIINQKNVGYY
ncbi:MAG: transglutaminase domain-containing protein [Acutalibacteraceae bacterium]